MSLRIWLMQRWWLAPLACILFGVAIVIQRPAPPAIADANLPGEEVPIMADIRHIPYLGAPHAAYNSVPPTSGPHVPQTVATGVYRTQIPEELQVHALEHGHVLIQYAPGTSEADVLLLEGMVREYRRDVIVAPYGRLESGVALTAWGRIERLERADQQRIAAFITALAGRYVHGRR